jgi:hypothetical protein
VTGLAEAASLNLLDSITALIRRHRLPFASIGVDPRNPDSSVVSVDAGSVSAAWQWAHALGTEAHATDRFVTARSIALPDLFVFARRAVTEPERTGARS